MKTLLMIAALAAVGWMLYTRFHTPENVKKVEELQKAPVQYVNSLQKDVEKAHVAADAMNAKIQKEAKDLQKSVEDQTK